MTLPKWRRLAQKLLPEIYESDRPETLYIFFFDLGPIADDALISGATDQLARIFAFTEWCLRHKEKYIWNAVGVSFYEHVFERKAAMSQVIPWLTTETYDIVEELLEWRLDRNLFLDIKQAMQSRVCSYEIQIAQTLSSHLELITFEINERETGENSSSAGTISPSKLSNGQTSSEEGKNL